MVDSGQIELLHVRECVGEDVLPSFDMIDIQVVGLEKQGPSEKSLIGKLATIEKSQWIVICVDLERFLSRLDIALKLLDCGDDGQELFLNSAVPFLVGI